MPFYSIPVNKRVLTWSSFRKRAGSPGPDGMAAYTYCTIDPSRLSLDSKTTPGKYRVNATRFTITVQVTQKSWVFSKAIEDDAESARLLNHERTHFLIASCVAYDLYQQIPDLEEDSAGGLQRSLNKAMFDAGQRMQAMNDQYDNDTSHGTIASEQARWDMKIETWDREQSE